MIKSVAQVADESMQPSAYPVGIVNDGSMKTQSERMVFLRRWIESPIEYDFGLAFSDHMRVQLFAPNEVPVNFHDKTIVLVPQLPAGRFRLDFAVLFKVDGRLHKWAVECDGRQWHTSEQQIAKDKKRDAALLQAGWRVLRFAGYSIHYGAGGMADRVHLEIDAYRSGQDSASIGHYFAPEQYEEIGDNEAARWYRETEPRSYQNMGQAA